MGQMDKFGTPAGLKDGPRSMNHDGGSKGTRQDSGTSAPLKHSAASSKFSTGGGSMETTGSMAGLGKSANKGYESASTPMSKRALAQGK
jgi:hypothetical protein